MKLLKSISFLYILLFGAVVFSSEAVGPEKHSSELNVIKVCQTEKAKYGFRMALANLILEKTQTGYGIAYLEGYLPANEKISQSRCLKLFESKKVDLLYLPPRASLLNHASFIPFDIHAGMLGYRVFVIHKEDQSKFSNVKSIEDLRKLVGGFGSQWADYKVFGLNDLPVVGAVNSATLYEMLKRKRFDYFHRGLHEAWAEIASMGELGQELMVEDSLALRYPYHVFFWFNTENELLKQRFETGLLLALQDGSYRRLFKRYFNLTIKAANFEERTIIDIDYPAPEGSQGFMEGINPVPFWQWSAD